MFSPVEVDGATLVVIAPRASVRGGYDAIERGRLCHDGSRLTLRNDDGDRVVDDSELDLLQPVMAGNRIEACRGYDYFILRCRDAT